MITATSSSMGLPRATGRACAHGFMIASKVAPDLWPDVPNRPSPGVWGQSGGRPDSELRREGQPSDP